MKKNVHLNPIILKMILLVSCFMLVIIYNQSQAAESTTVHKSKVAVSFLRSSEKDELNVIVKPHSKVDLQLFLFNTDGVLVKEIAVGSKKVTTIKNLTKGCYLYECFKKDTRITSGSVIIK